MRNSHLYPKLLATTLLSLGLAAGAARPALAAPDAEATPPEHCASHGGGHEMHGGGHRMGMMGGDHQGMMGGDHLPPFLRGLELTEAQRDKIFELHHAIAPRQRELFKAVKSSREALHNLAHGDNFDAKQARQLADNHAKAVAELALLHAETGAKIRALLTPEQRKQADERRSRFEHRGHDGHHPA
jgi:Spy/CpxP family protein refolding chaperone